MGVDRKGVRILKKNFWILGAVGLYVDFRRNGFAT